MLFRSTPAVAVIMVSVGFGSGVFLDSRTGSAALQQTLTRHTITVIPEFLHPGRMNQGDGQSSHIRLSGAVAGMGSGMLIESLIFC